MCRLTLRGDGADAPTTMSCLGFLELNIGRSGAPRSLGNHGRLTCLSIEPLVPAQSREVQMVAYMPLKARHEARNVYATITRIVGGYTITVAMRKAGRTRTLVETTVESQFAAETVASGLTHSEDSRMR